MPKTLFQDPESDILLASDSTFMGARIATDGQWRFPASSHPSSKVEEAIITFEDKRFYRHLGVDFFALCRATRQNIRAHRVVSGGSTLSMQVIRLARKGQPRTFSEKIGEMIQASRLELRYSKKEILQMYLNHAPFGSNIVGIESASWRYFGRPSSDLSWAEAATLAVLPNAPSMIHPGRNRDFLQKKRDSLLKRLYENQQIDPSTYQLALEESLPQKPLPLPNLTPHFFDYMRKKGIHGVIRTTLDASLQQQVASIANRYAQFNQLNRIGNMAIIVVNLPSKTVSAYVGNVKASAAIDNGSQVDMVRANRSTGSLLKPFLYAGMIDAGQLLPTSLVPDVPLYLNGFAPQNFNHQFQGVVPANQAIIRSLNVPLVKMLQEYDYGRFYELLEKMGMNSLSFPASHYGLSLILGGAEGSLYNLVQMYASAASVLNSASTERYTQKDFLPLRTLYNDTLVTSSGKECKILSRAALWYAFQAMSELNRPEEESQWQAFSGQKKIAWKTGTSFGARDAWAIGLTPDYVVGVWVGNASGEGIPGLTGVGNAAPVLFDVFRLLPKQHWFEQPTDEMQEIPICRLSGYRAGPYCEPVDTLLEPNVGMNTPICPFHQLVQLDEEGRYRVNSACYSPSRMLIKKWFVLPPKQAWYFRNYDINYQPLPPLMPGCRDEVPRLDILYPENGMRLFVPKGFEQQREKIVLKASHTFADATLFWHLNDTFLGSTHDPHQLAISPDPGDYVLTVMDEYGNKKKIRFHVVSNKRFIGIECH